MHKVITPSELKAMLEGRADVQLFDVRRSADYDADHSIIPGAVYRDPGQVSEWAQEVRRERPVIIYCVRGGSVSRSVHDALHDMGIQAYFLEGGITAWRDAGFETVAKSL